MHTFFQEYITLIDNLHAAMKADLVGMPAEALDWIPAEGMNSLAVLVTHTVAAERYWIGDVVMGELSDRDRDAEFRVRGLDAEVLIQRLDNSLTYTKSALSRLELSDLDRECISPRDGRRFTASWALLHALEHTANHVGHCQLTSQLWKEQN